MENKSAENINCMFRIPTSTKWRSDIYVWGSASARAPHPPPRRGGRKTVRDHRPARRCGTAADGFAAEDGGTGNIPRPKKIFPPPSKEAPLPAQTKSKKKETWDFVYTRKQVFKELIVNTKSCGWGRGVTGIKSGYSYPSLSVPMRLVGQHQT